MFSEHRQNVNRVFFSILAFQTLPRRAHKGPSIVFWGFSSSNIFLILQTSSEDLWPHGQANLGNRAALRINFLNSLFCLLLWQSAWHFVKQLKQGYILPDSLRVQSTTAGKTCYPTLRWLLCIHSEEAEKRQMQLLAFSIVCSPRSSPMG